MVEVEEVERRWWGRRRRNRRWMRDEVEEVKEEEG